MLKNPNDAAGPPGSMRAARADQRTVHRPKLSQETHLALVQRRTAAAGGLELTSTIGIVKIIAALWQWLTGFVRGAGKRDSSVDGAAPATGNAQRPVPADSTIEVGVTAATSKAPRASASASTTDVRVTRTTSKTQRTGSADSMSDVGVAPTKSKSQRPPAAKSPIQVGATPTASNAQRANASEVWSQDSALLPWYDQPDWAGRLERMRHDRQLSATDEAMLRNWCEDGYVVAPGLIAAELIDAFIEEIDDMWERNDPIGGLAVSGVDLDDGHHVHVPHSELVRIHLAQRRRIKEISNWRVGQCHLYSKSARKIFDHSGVGQIASTIFARRGEPRYSSMFCKGTELGLRQDTCFFHIFPRNFMMGIWIACEDVKPEAGPFEFYPGSQHAPLFSEFTNYPQTNRRTSDPAQRKRYDDYIVNLAKSYQKHELLIRKGDVMFWHPMLIHGGSPRLDRIATRKSLVLHNIAEGADVGEKISGTIKW